MVRYRGFGSTPRVLLSTPAFLFVPLNFCASLYDYHKLIRPAGCLLLLLFHVICATIIITSSFVVCGSTTPRPATVCQGLPGSARVRQYGCTRSPSSPVVAYQHQAAGYSLVKSEAQTGHTRFLLRSQASRLVWLCWTSDRSVPACGLCVNARLSSLLSLHQHPATAPPLCPRAKGLSVEPGLDRRRLAGIASEWLDFLSDPPSHTARARVDFLVPGAEHLFV